MSRCDPPAQRSLVFFFVCDCLTMETTVYRIGGYRKSTDGTVQVLVFLSQSSSGCLFFSFSSRLLRNILLSSFQFSFHSFQLPFCFLLRISTFFRISSYQFSVSSSLFRFISSIFLRSFHISFLSYLVFLSLSFISAQKMTALRSPTPGIHSQRNGGGHRGGGAPAAAGLAQ